MRTFMLCWCAAFSVWDLGAGVWNIFQADYGSAAVDFACLLLMVFLFLFWLGE